MKNSLITHSISLIREHCDGTDESFKQAALNLAAFFDKNDKSDLAEYIFALIYPETAFTTFEIQYNVGNIVKDNKTGEWYKIVGSVEQGIYISPLNDYPESVKFVSRGSIEWEYTLV